VTGEAYLWGVLAAVAAGVGYNLGLVVQKIAVGRVDDGDGFLRRLVRNPLWLRGLALQFLIGVPLNLVAQATIGPALIPGLMGTGLVVLALGAVYLVGEAVGRQDWAGIALVMVAVALFGLSGLGVDMAAIDPYDLAFVARLVVFTTAVAALSVACFLLQARSVRLRGVARTLDAGLLLAQSNLWLGVLMAFWGRWQQGLFGGWDFLGLAVTSAVVVAGTALGTAETQRAFQVGDASKLMPIQSVPQQILPLLSYFAVFALTPPSDAALPLVGAGAALILAGTALLARRQVLVSGDSSRR
jgi:drug/metabolite transporter (DMT)-like permease